MTFRSWVVDTMKYDMDLTLDTGCSHAFDKLLLEDKLRSLEEEIKNVSAELCKNFTEEAYLRQSALKKERDEILAAAAEPEE